MARVAAPQVTCAASSARDAQYRVLVVGESWAAGDRLYPDLPQELSARLGVPVQTCTIGFSGRNSHKIYRGLKAHLSRVSMRESFGGRLPDLVLVLNGVNDQIQHVGPATYADETANIVSLFSGAKVKVVSAPRIQFDDRALSLSLRLKSRLQRLLFDHGKPNPVLEYRARLRGSHPDIDVIDYDQFMPQFNASMYRVDGIHLTGSGFHQYGGFLAINALPPLH